MDICFFSDLWREFNESSMPVKLFAVVGSYHVLSLCFQFLSFLLSLFRPSLNLEKRYGENSWAIVTGPTEGIGKSFCFSLAKRGFNVILIARNEEKANGVVEQVAKKYPKVQFKVVKCEFGEIISNEGLVDTIMKSIQDLDVSILINNVGISNRRGSGMYYASQSLSDISHTIAINAGAQAVLTHALLPKLLKRQQKSAVINLSSFAGTIPTPFLEIYTGTKAFNRHLSESLAMEYQDKIDFQALCPMVVESVMTTDIIKSGMKGTISAEQCTESSLYQLGRERVTIGHFIHRLQGGIVHLIPKQLAMNIMGKEMIVMDERIQKLHTKKD